MERTAPAGSRMDQLLNRLRNDVIGIREQGDALAKQMWLLYITFEDFMHIQHPERSKQLMKTSLNVDNCIAMTSMMRPSQQVPRNKMLHQQDLEKLDGTVSPKKEVRSLRMLKERKWRQNQNTKQSNESTINNIQCGFTDSINGITPNCGFVNHFERTESKDRFVICSDSKYDTAPSSTNAILCAETIVHHTSIERTSFIDNEASDLSDIALDDSVFVTSFTDKPVDCRVARKTNLSARKHREITSVTQKDTLEDYHDVSCPLSPHYSPCTISSGYSSEQDYHIAYDEVSDRLLCHQNVTNQISWDVEENDEADDNYIILADDKYEYTHEFNKLSNRSHRSRRKERLVYVSEKIQDVDQLSTKNKKISPDTKQTMKLKADRDKTNSPYKKIAGAVGKMDHKLFSVTRSMKDIIHDLAIGPQNNSKSMISEVNLDSTFASRLSVLDRQTCSTQTTETNEESQSCCKSNEGTADTNTHCHGDSVSQKLTSTSCSDMEFHKTCTAQVSVNPIINLNSAEVPMSTENSIQPYDSGRSSMSDSFYDIENADDFNDATLPSTSVTTPHVSERKMDDSQKRMSYDSASLYEDDVHIYMTIPDDCSDISLTPKYTPPPALPPRNYTTTSVCDKISVIKNTSNEEDETAKFRHLQGVKADVTKTRNIYTETTPTSMKDEIEFVMGAKYIPAFFSPEANTNENNRSHFASGYASDRPEIENTVRQLNQLNLSHCPADVALRDMKTGTPRIDLNRPTSSAFSSCHSLMIPTSNLRKSNIVSGNLNDSIDQVQSTQGNLTQQWAAALPTTIKGTYC